MSLGIARRRGVRPGGSFETGNVDRINGGSGRDHAEGGTGANRCPDLTAADTSNACTTG